MSIEEIVNWPFWGDSLAALFIMTGLFFSRFILQLLLLIFVQSPYKKFIKHLLFNLRPSFQGLLILSGFLLETYRGTLFPLNSILLNQLSQSLMVILAGWGLWRQCNQTRELITLFDQEFNRSFHDLAIPLIRRGAKLGILLTGFLCLSYVWGFDTGNWVTSLGVFGIVISFSAKDMIRNIFGAFVLLVNDAFDIGDWIETRQTLGAVEDISLRFTKIRTLSEGIVTIPNADLANGTLINWSRKKKRLAELLIHLDPGCRRDALAQGIRKIATELPKRGDLHADSVLCDLRENANLCIDLYIRFHTKTTDQGMWAQVKVDSYRQICAILDEFGLNRAEAYERPAPRRRSRGSSRKEN